MGGPVEVDLEDALKRDMILFLNEGRRHCA